MSEKKKVNLFMATKRNGEFVPRPLSAIRAVKNDGITLEVLAAATAAAKDALDQRLANPQWVQHVNLEGEFKEANEAHVGSSERLERLRARRDQYNLVIKEEKKRLAQLAANREDRKRAFEDHVVPEDVSAAIELASEQYKKAKVDEADGVVRNAEKNVKNRVEKVLSELADDPDHAFDIDEMVPLLVDYLVVWYRQMRYTIDVPEVKPEADEDRVFQVENALSRFNYMVKKTGFSKYVVLDFLKNPILPMIHKLDGYVVWGVAASGAKYTGKVLHRGIWSEMLPQYNWLIPHCWKAKEKESEEKKESEEEERTGSAAADTAASVPLPAAVNPGNFVDLCSD